MSVPIGLVKGAQLASSGIRRGSELIAEKIQPVTAPIAVDPKVKVGIDVAKKGSKAAVVAGKLILSRADRSRSKGQSRHRRRQEMKQSHRCCS